MRVALVSARTVHHADAGPAAERHDSLRALLAGRGHDVTVFCAQWWDGDHDAFEHDGVAYRALEPAPGERWAPLRLLPALRSFDPDVVHVADPRPGFVFGARLASALGAPVVTEYYDPPSDDRLTRWAAAASDAVVVPSAFVGTAVREASVPGEALHRIPNAVEMERVRAVEADPDAGDVVYSRTLDADANLESVLLALAEFRDYDWSATVVGDGPERANYERQARDMGIADRVSFVGEQSLDDRLALFKGAHVYAQTAYRTSFPTDLLRALACGCVGVVEYHADSAAHELVEGDARGFLATSDEELVDCLRDATDVERLDIDESYAAHDERAFLERYLSLYRDLGAV
ncbi:glycosyltransferase [Halarchaeum sp. CBA1220]|uniref:glycosyltransferase n=1 Tax=Halarchaeum sp. CBA1220 TaxID=1853682 RepID=UPI000F3AA7F9|nr:glycosyltransferase [Halarchaeum sp. CBA1220]QLC33887.1 glycosyltransferase [Halarchaeum sp. CBA1220]